MQSVEKEQAQVSNKKARIDKVGSMKPVYEGESAVEKEKVPVSNLITDREKWLDEAAMKDAQPIEKEQSRVRSDLIEDRQCCYGLVQWIVHRALH